MSYAIDSNNLENSNLVQKTFLFAEEIAYGMLGLKVSPAAVVMTFVFFIGGIETETAYGQSSAPFANCISIFYEGDSVQLAEDADCDSKQFAEAVTHYKTNGYPHEESYSDFGFGKTMQLYSEKFMQDLKELGMD